MYCPKCGKPIPDGSKVCPECHERISKGIHLELPRGTLNLIGIAGCLFGLLGIFLPMMTVNILGTKQSMGNVFDYSWLMGLLLFIINIGAAVLYYMQMDQIAMVCGAIEFGSAIFMYLRLRSQIHSLSNEIIDVSSFAKVGSGLYLLLLAGIIILLSPMIMRRLKR